MNKNDFNFHIPVEIEKSKDGKDWFIRGLASTEDIDGQNEIILQRGLDISHLKKGLGLFNFDHNNDPQNIIGQITNADQTEEGLYVEGYLFKNQPQAQSIYNIMSSLKKGAKRRVQMSIEGKVLDRKGNKIAKAKVLNVALTLNPVNTKTYAEFVKSFAHQVDSDSNEETTSSDSELSLSLPQALIDLETKVDTLCEMLHKSIEAGNYDVPPSSRTGGVALASESMDKKIKNLAHKIKRAYPKLNDKDIAKIAYMAYKKQSNK